MNTYAPDTQVSREADLDKIKATLERLNSFPKYQRPSAIALNILDIARAMIETLKEEPCRRFMGKKNRTPKNRIKRMFLKSKRSLLMQSFLVNHMCIVSKPIPKFPLGTKLFYNSAIVGENDKAEIIYLPRDKKL